MSESKTSISGKFGDAKAPEQELSWIEIQLVDEQGEALVSMPWRAENEASKDKVIKPYEGVSDENGMIRIDKLLHPDLTLFIRAQPLTDEMEKRPLAVERVSAYQMKMSPVMVDKESGCICYYTVIGHLCDAAPDIPGWTESQLPEFHFPDPEFSGLKISNMYFNARVIVKVCPFRAWNLLLHHTKEYSIVNAMNLGLMANLAYEKKEKVISFFNQNCQDLSMIPYLPFWPIAVDVPFRQRYVNPVFLDTAEGDDGEAGTQLFYVTNDRQLLIAWRGTEPNKWADIATDGTFLPVSCPSIVASGGCHRGFLEAFELVVNKFTEQEKVLKSLVNGRNVFICGHSLGGALTLIHAATLQEFEPLIYTYGMPRTFTKMAVSTLNNIIHYRHVNDADSVTSIPMEVDVDTEMFKLWANLAVIYGFSSSAADALVKAKVGKADPFWHHGNIVSFFKAQQSMVKLQNRPLPAIGIDIKSNCIKIKKILFTKCKLYLVPELNEEAFFQSQEKQKKYIQYLDPESIKNFLPDNTNPSLDSLTNPLDHSISSKYIPYINNQLIELVDPQRPLERKTKREEFARQVDDMAQSLDKSSVDEVSRNKLFLALQNLLPATLFISESSEEYKRALARFKEIAKEEYEKIN
ncbi:lipase family protein [Erwinia sp. Eh17-17]|uniref:lipase family protein n=1 Tax=Erwinia sp. Eh17-17 TaxID=3080330 RepID=UPI0032096289